MDKILCRVCQTNEDEGYGDGLCHDCGLSEEDHPGELTAARNEYFGEQDCRYRGEREDASKMENR